MLMNDQKIITIDLWKAVVIIFSAVLGSAGASIWGTLSFVNAAPFQIIAIEKDISGIKDAREKQDTMFMPLDLSTERWKNNESQHADIMKKLDSIQLSIERIK